LRLPHVVSIDFWQYKVEVEVELRGILVELKSLCPSYIYDLWVKDRSVLAMASQTRRALSLEERMQMVKSYERGESSRSIAERLGVGQTQIQINTDTEHN